MLKNNLNANGGLWMDGTQLFSTDKELMQGSSNLVQAISYTTALAFSSTNISRSGVTYIYPADYTNLSSSDRGQLSLNSPYAGCQKTIMFDSGSTNVLLDVKLTGASIFGTSDWSTVGTTSVRYIHFSSAVNDIQSIDLIGLSTNQWAVKGVNMASTALSGWNVATGIRTSTAARTS